MTEVAEIIVRLTRGEGISASEAVMYAQHHIKQAVAAEREACAKIADEGAYYGTADGAEDMASTLAKLIRERDKQIDS